MYSMYDRELLACYMAIKKFRHFLEGCQFELHTYHKSLNPSLFRERLTDSDRQQQQLANLAEVTTNFKYIADSINTVAASLSGLLARKKRRRMFGKSHWIAVFGVPTLLLSNRSTQFTSAYCQLFAIWSETMPLPSRSQWDVWALAQNAQDSHHLFFKTAMTG